MSKRLSKEELERDALAEFIGKTAQIYQSNRTAVLSLIVGLIVVIGSTVGYYYYSTAQEQKAQNLLAVAERYYSNGEYEKALNGDEADFTVGMLQIIDNYSGTDAANLATYYAAVSYFKLGELEQALSYMEKYNVPDGILGVGPLSFYGNLLETKGNLEEAANMYEKAAYHEENASTTPYNLLKAADAYSEAGNPNQARELLTTIIEEYPNSMEVAEAERLMGKLVAAS